MPNNLNISYDLREPQQNYPKVIAKIKTLGIAVRANYSLWFVSSSMTAAQARDAILPMLDSDDRLYIVDATNNEAAWHNLEPGAADIIKKHWNIARTR